MVILLVLWMLEFQMMNWKNNIIPEQQDIIWIDFQPSKGNEMRGRHPAMVLSLPGYTMQTGLVMVMPITHARHNRLRAYFIGISEKSINGFINPLQTYTFSVKARHVELTGERVNDLAWAKALQIHEQIVGIN